MPSAIVETALKTYDDNQLSRVLLFSRTSASLLIASSATFRFWAWKNRSRLEWSCSASQCWRLCGVIEDRFHCGELLTSSFPKQSFVPPFILLSRTSIIEGFATMYTCFILCLLILASMLIIYGIHEDLLYIDFLNRIIVTSVKILSHTESFNFCLPMRKQNVYDSVLVRDLQYFIDTSVQTICADVFNNFSCDRRNELVTDTKE